MNRRLQPSLDVLAVESALRRERRARKPCPHGPCPDCPDRPDGRMLEECLETMLRRERRWLKRQRRKLNRRKTMTNMQIYDKTKDAVDAWLKVGGIGGSLSHWLQEDASPADELLYAPRRVAARFTREDVHLEPGLRDLIMRLDAAVARLSNPEADHGA